MCTSLCHSTCPFCDAQVDQVYGYFKVGGNIATCTLLGILAQLESRVGLLLDDGDRDWLLHNYHCLKAFKDQLSVHNEGNKVRLLCTHPALSSL